ncbi:alpha/beta hydrolase [Polymorphobacter sp.]|uniref:alpha/beta hydrolase n=1 Tax=Polymorphobacter sp. TaxID=1909290 RepID=UPI003F6E59ED
MAEVLSGLARYQSMPPAPPRPERPIIAAEGVVTLRDYGNGLGQPVLVIPSLINPPTVLDLAPGQSLLAALAAAGLRPLLVDWGPAPERLGLTGLVEKRLLPLLGSLGAPLPVLGYCLGGTLAVALASCAPVSRLALLATPWHFTGYSAKARQRLAEWWAAAAPLADLFGGLPMDLLQPAFWSLDEAALIAKYARLANADEARLEAFAALEDWSNSGPPLSLAAAGDMAGFFADDAPGRGAWQVCNNIAGEGLTMPILDVVAMQDRIVPAAAALSTSGPGTRLEIAAGHVGMIVGRNAADRLYRPLTDWLLAR